MATACRNHSGTRAHDFFYGAGIDIDPAYNNHVIDTAKNSTFQRKLVTAA